MANDRSLGHHARVELPPEDQPDVIYVGPGVRYPSSTKTIPGSRRSEPRGLLLAVITLSLVGVFFVAGSIRWGAFPLLKRKSGPDDVV